MGIYGWADAHRDEDDWSRRYAEQTELLHAQLAALRAGPAARRRKFRALEYVCSRCGDTMLEVMRTSPHWTLITWPASDGQRGQWAFLPLADPLPDPSSVAADGVPTSCRCQSWDALPKSLVMADLQAGTTKRALTAQAREET